MKKPNTPIIDMIDKVSTKILWLLGIFCYGLILTAIGMVVAVYIATFGSVI